MRHSVRGEEMVLTAVLRHACVTFHLIYELINCPKVSVKLSIIMVE